MTLSLASLPTSILPAVSKSGFSPAPLFQSGESVPGTTDGILIMGILILFIIALPIVAARRRWMK